MEDLKFVSAPDSFVIQRLLRLMGYVVGCCGTMRFCLALSCWNAGLFKWYSIIAGYVGTCRSWRAVEPGKPMRGCWHAAQDLAHGAGIAEAQVIPAQYSVSCRHRCCSLGRTVCRKVLVSAVGGEDIMGVL
jgi:hypothetical protein